MICDLNEFSESSQHGSVFVSNFIQVFGGSRRVTGKLGVTRDVFLCRYNKLTEIEGN